MKLKALFEKLAKKSGVDITSDEFKAIVIPDVEVAEDVAAGMEKGLFNLDAAKNNADIRKAIRVETLNGLDKKVLDTIVELGYDDADADEVKNEANSFEKVAKLTKLIKTKEAAKAKSTTKVDKDGYDAQVAELNRQLKAEKDGRLADQNQHKSDTETSLTNFELQSILMGKDYSLPKEMGTKLKLSTAKAAIEEKLQSQGFKIIRSENGALTIVDKEGKPAYDSKTNERIDLNPYIDGALAQNNLLKVNDSPDPTKSNNSTIITGDGKTVAPTFQNGISELDKMIAAETAKA